MSRVAKAASKGPISTSDAQRVGAAEFRGNLAKYLKQAKAGTPVIIQERERPGPRFPSEELRLCFANARRIRLQLHRDYSPA